MHCNVSGRENRFYMPHACKRMDKIFKNFTCRRDVDFWFQWDLFERIITILKHFESYIRIVSLVSKFSKSDEHKISTKIESRVWYSCSLKGYKHSVLFSCSNFC